MFKKNLILTTLLVSLCISSILSFPFTVNANTPTEKDKIISTDEFINALKKEYSKYGIDIQVQDQNNAQPVTQKMLDTYMENIQKQQAASPETKENGIVEIAVQNNPYARTITTCSAYKAVSNTHGHASLKITAKISHSGNTYKSCSSLKSSQSGGAINFEKWVQKSYSKTPVISLAPGHVRFNVVGELTTFFSIAGIKFTSTTEESFGVEFTFN